MVKGQGTEKKINAKDRKLLKRRDKNIIISIIYHINIIVFSAMVLWFGKVSEKKRQGEIMLNSCL